MIIHCFAFETLQEYKENFDNSTFEKPGQCSHCGKSDCFWRHGNFKRRVIEDGEETIVKIPRLLCHSCGKTVSLLFSFLIAHTRYTSCTVAAGIEAYSSTETTYRQVSMDLSALDCQDKPPFPSHHAVFRWVRETARRAKKLSFQIQKEAALRAIDGVLHFSHLSFCPNELKARTELKRETLNDLSECIQLGTILVGKHTGTVLGLYTFFLKKVETIQMILCNHLIELLTPQKMRHAVF